MNLENLIKWFDSLTADIAAWLTRYWNNVIVIAGVLLLWWMVVGAIVVQQELPPPISWSDHESQNGWWMFALLLLAICAGLTWACQLVNDNPFIIAGIYGTGVLVFFLFMDPIAYFSGKSYHQSMTAFLHENWAINVGLVALWLLGLSSYTLIFVFRHHRVKLRRFWYWFLANLLIISGAYQVHALLGMLIALTTPHFLRGFLVAPGERAVTLAGREVLTDRQVAQIYRQKQKGNPQLTVPWGNVAVPFSELTQHFVAFGATGSGKTLNLLILFRTYLYHIYPGSSYKAIIYDAAREMPALLQGMALGAKVYLLNPFDARSVRWDMAKDFTDIAQAYTLAEMLAPEAEGGGENARYFHQAAVECLYGIIAYLMRNARYWTLADIIRSFQSEPVLRGILESDEFTKDTLQVLATDKTSASIISTVCTEIKKYSIVAALWETCTESISITEFMQGGSIVVLGRSEQTPKQLKALNNLWMQKTAQILLDGPSVSEPQTMFFIDETASVKFQDFSTLLTEVRKKGGFCVLGVQNIRRLNKAYGADEAATVISQCRFKAMLRVEDDDTADFCSKLIGDAEVKIMTASYEFRSDIGRLIGHGEKTGIAEQRRFQRAVLASEFMAIPAVDFANNVGVTGFFTTEHVHKTTYSVKQLKALLPTPDPDYSNFVPKPAQDMVLKPWSDADLERLNLNGVFARLRQQELEAQLKENHFVSSLTPPPPPPMPNYSLAEWGLEETEDIPEGATEEESTPGQSPITPQSPLSKTPNRNNRRNRLTIKRPTQGQNHQPNQQERKR